MADKILVRTSRQQIVTFWSSRVYEGDLGVDWCDAHERCWRCGMLKNENRLDRCHIVPAQEPFCGPDSPENLVLLCSRCHEEAPSCSDPAEMWAWIKLTRATVYDIYWVERDWKELKNLHDVDIVSELSTRDANACLHRYREVFVREVGIHSFAKPFSLASKAFVWRKVLSEIP